MKKLKLFLLILVGLFSLNAMAFENLMYTWRGFPTEITEGQIAIKDLKAHGSQIDILSSQAYHIDENGVLYGAVNPEMVQIAKQHHIKFMPIVTNGDFERAKVHAFLNNPAAQNRAIQSLVQLCKQNNYYGVQIDFENMSVVDRDAFTQFFQKVATALHDNNIRVSLAIIPQLTAAIPTTDYLKSRYENESGVYDYKPLGESSDFVTLMTYDQHGAITPPGPMAGITWIEAIVQYALKYIPADKISIGIPLHSGHWYTGKDTPDSPVRAIAIDVSYPQVTQIIKDNNLTLRWENADKVHYAMFRKDFLYEYIFMEDAESFKAKLELVKKYHLRGISSWCLGEEDPKIWKVLARFQK